MPVFSENKPNDEGTDGLFNSAVLPISLNLLLHKIIKERGVRLKIDKRYDNVVFEPFSRNPQ